MMMDASFTRYLHSALPVVEGLNDTVVMAAPIQKLWPDSPDFSQQDGSDKSMSTPCHHCCVYCISLLAICVAVPYM